MNGLTPFPVWIASTKRQLSKQRIFASLALPLLSLLPLTSHADPKPFELSSDLSVTSPIAHATILEENGPTLSVDETVTGVHDAEFQSIPANRTSLGITDSAWWIRFEATNPTIEPITWILNFPISLTDLVDIYEVDSQGGVHHTALGDKRAVSQKPIPGAGFAAPITTPAGGSTTVYTRLQQRLGDGLDTFFEVSSPRAYAEKQRNIWLLCGILLGGGIAIFLYNLVVYLGSRDPIYLWYLLYLFFALGTFVAAEGLGSKFFWSHEGLLSEAVLPLFSALTFLFALQFSRRFLGTKTVLPRCDRFLRGLMVYFFLPPIAFFSGYSGLAAGMLMIGVIAMSFLPGLGAFLWIRGHRLTPFFTIAWLIWVFSIGAMALRMLGVLPTNDFTVRVGWIGIMGEAVLFAFALADRIRLLQSDKIAAEVRERESLVRSRAELSSLVAARTLELQRSNSEKDKFFSIIAHDLRAPFNGLLGLSEFLTAGFDSMSRDEIETCVRDIHQSADNLHTLLENLLSWALIHQGKLKFEPTSLELDPIISRCISIFASAAQAKSVAVESIGPPNVLIRADPQSLEMVIRNLLSNALKFSRPGDKVTISTQLSGGSVEIAVIDHGVGMDPRTTNNLLNSGTKTSSPGTSGEKGTGLGLQLCQEVLDLHGTTLQVESQINQGTTFRFALPINHRGENANGETASA